MSKRKSKNWLLDFNRWVTPRSEAPASYIFWTGLLALASAVKRKVWIPKTLLGGWNCYPCLYVFLIGPSGMRKTTTMDMMDEIYSEIPTIAHTPQSATQEAVMDLLVNQKDSALTIFSKEFGNFWKNSTTKMIEFLTAAFDGNAKFDNLTLSRKLETVYNPSVNMLAATTPEWIAINFDIAMLKGGFASRIIWLYESELRRHQLFYSGIDYSALDDLKKILIEDLYHIEQNLLGEVQIEEEDQLYMESWYKNFMKSEAPSMDNRVQGYVARKARHTLAVATLLHIAKSDDLVVTRHDFDAALKVLHAMEHRLPQVFSTVGGNPYTLSMDEIVNYVARKVKVERRQLLARFNHAATPDVLQSLLVALVLYQRLKYTETGDYYEVVEVKSSSA